MTSKFMVDGNGGLALRGTGLDPEGPGGAASSDVAVFPSGDVIADPAARLADGWCLAGIPSGQMLTAE